MLRTLEELRERAVREASDRGPGRVAVVGADAGTALGAVMAAAGQGFAVPVLVGDEKAIRAAAAREGIPLPADVRLVPAGAPAAAAREAARLAGAGEVDVLLKGSVRSDEILRAVLDREHGLRTGGLLSDVLLYEDVLSGERRLVGVTDGGVNVAPDEDALRRIVANAVAVFLALGWERPRVALLSATEAVSEGVPSTVAARAVAQAAWPPSDPADTATPRWLPGPCHVDGPLALDNALLRSAAEAKGIGGPVAGRADILVAPSIEAGNVLGKGVKYFGGSLTAHVVFGARVPVLIPSRVESAADKLLSVALGVLVRDLVVPEGGR